MPDKRRVPRPAIIVGNTARIPLGIKAKDGYAIVDSDMAWLADKHKWVLDSSKRYAITGTYEVGGRRVGTVYLHKVIVGLGISGMVDHISRDKLDNRRCNLRLANNRINQLNTAHRGGTSQYRGVCWDKLKSKWKAALKNNGVTINLGYFVNETDAARAYNEAAVQYFGEYASLNNIEMESQDG